MEKIIVVKFFLVLFCNSNGDFNSYEVSSIESPTETGIIHCNKKYNIGDTIRFEYIEYVVEVKR
jgi:hypothetical protein